MQNKILTILIFIAVLVFLGGLTFFLKEPSALEEQTTTTGTTTSGGIALVSATSSDTTDGTEVSTTSSESVSLIEKKALLYAGRKEPKMIVFIDFVRFLKGGYIVVYERSLEPIGEVVAMSAYYPPGEYTNTPVMFGRLPENEEVFDMTLYVDDGDRIFDPIKDALYKDDSGYAVSATLVMENLSSQDEEAF